MDPTVTSIIIDSTDTFPVSDDDDGGLRFLPPPFVSSLINYCMFPPSLFDM